MNNFIEFLINNQRDDGSFEVFSNCDRVFFTALVLANLNGTEENLEIKQRAVAFLLSKKNSKWIFSRNINKNFCILSALMEYDSDLLDGVAVGEILNLLTLIESEVGGPYFSDKKSKIIDLATNVQIAYFLSLHEVSLPNLDTMIDTAIINQNYQSDFYQSAMPIVYLISKFYKGEHQTELIDYVIINKGDNYWGNSFDRLFALLALKNLEFNEEYLREEIDYLKYSATWREEEKYLEKSSFEISLFLLLQAEKKKKNIIIEENLYEEEEMMKKILILADKRFENLKGEMKVFAKQEIEKTILKNCDRQMSLMAYFMKKALGKKGEIFSDNFVAELGLSNIFFWNAFIIYDDFWDEEGIPKILPTANLYARDFIKYFNLILPKESGLTDFFDRLMDRLDAANTWETVYCRAKVEGSIIQIPEILPDYSDYEIAFEPASAHILGPLVMMYKIGYALDSEEAINLIEYFRNYLIAMQLNDDALDWEEDLARGHLSTVVVMLLQDYLEIYPDCKEIDMTADLLELKKIYWFKTVKRMGQTVLRHTDKSRTALFKLQSIENINFLEKLIIISESVAQKALVEQTKTIDFLNSFNGG